MPARLGSVLVTGSKWLPTITGKRVNPTDLHPADICIEDIAHALALVNRFAGHTPEPISVAQHSVCVARLVRAGLKRQALLHDASEAYIGDVTKWLKATDLFAGYRQLEMHMQADIFMRFGEPVLLHHDIEFADRLMVRFEGQMAFGQSWIVQHPDLPEGQPHDNYPPLSQTETQDILNRLGGWYPWGWREAEREFLREWNATIDWPL